VLPRILIVEDDLVIREIYALKFELEGYPVQAAENGALALELIEEFQPHYILLDMMMPVMDGLTFMRHYSTREETGEVIVFSNVSSPAQREAIMRLGARDYWVKSDYTPQEVVAALATRWSDRNPSSASV
jgi:CheY-like chemotaxis protein